MTRAVVLFWLGFLLGFIPSVLCLLKRMAEDDERINLLQQDLDAARTACRRLDRERRLVKN